MIGAVTSEAFKFLPRAIGPSAPWVLLYCLASGVFNVLPLLADPASFDVLLYMLAGGLVALVAGVLLSARLYQLALPEADRSLPQVAQRLILSNLLVYIAFGIVLFLLGLFFSITAGILIAVSGYDPSEAGDPADVTTSIVALSSSGAGVVIYLLLAVALAGLIYLSLRLVLYGAATAAEGRPLVFETWGWTRGAVRSLFVVALATHLAPYLAAFVVNSLIATAFGLPSAFDFATAVEQPITDPATAFVWAVIGTLIASPGIILGHGMAAAAYRRLAPTGQAAVEAFD